MRHIHPIKTHQNNAIFRVMDRASGVVATSVWDQMFEQETDSYRIPIGRKPDRIGTVHFEAMVGADAVRKLGILGIYDVEYSPVSTDEASRCQAEGYVNHATDYNRNNLVIVMNKLLPANVYQLGATGLHDAVQFPFAEAS